MKPNNKALFWTCNKKKIKIEDVVNISLQKKIILLQGNLVNQFVFFYTKNEINKVLKFYHETKNN